MSSRRDFITWLSAASGIGTAAIGRTESSGRATGVMRAKRESSMPPTGADVGSLFPFVQSQVSSREPTLSFLRDEFHDLKPWKHKARARLLDLLHYDSPKCDPRPQVLAKTDHGDYVQERILFNTT